LPGALFLGLTLAPSVYWGVLVTPDVPAGFVTDVGGAFVLGA
jgi:hypothetical protein